MNVPANWYDDPYAPGAGRLRYWDGQQWTAHTHDPAAQAAPAEQAAPEAQQSPAPEPAPQPAPTPTPAPAAEPAAAQQPAPVSHASPPAQSATASHGSRKRASIIASVIGASMALVLVATGAVAWVVIDRNATSSASGGTTSDERPTEGDTGLPLCGTEGVEAVAAVTWETMTTSEPVCESAENGYVYTTPVTGLTDRSATIPFPATVARASAPAAAEVPLTDAMDWGFTLFADASLTKELGLTVSNADEGTVWEIDSRECPFVEAHYSADYRAAAGIEDAMEIFQIRDNYTELDPNAAVRSAWCEGWGLRDNYYLVRHVDEEGEPLETPIVSQFSFTHRLDKPSVAWTTAPDTPGTLMAEWDAVDGAKAYGIIKSWAAYDDEGAFLERRYEMVGASFETSWVATESFSADVLADDLEYFYIDQNVGLELSLHTDDVSDTDGEPYADYEYAVVALMNATDGSDDWWASPLAATDAADIAADLPHSFAYNTWNERHPDDSSGEELLGPQFATIEGVPVTVPVSLLSGVSTDAPAVLGSATLGDPFEADGETWFQVGLFAAGTRLGAPVKIPGPSTNDALAFIDEFNTYSLSQAPQTGAEDSTLRIFELPEAEVKKLAPEVPYPIQAGSHPFVEFLAAHFVARSEAIDMSGWTGQAGMPDITDAAYEAMDQNPYSYLDYFSWRGDTMYVDYAYDDGVYQEHQESLAASVTAAVAAAVPDGASERDAAVAINQWIIDKVDYDHAAFEQAMLWQQDPGDLEWEDFKDEYDLRHAWEANGVFDTSAVVCASYSMAFGAMAMEAGLDARYVTGMVSAGRHAWNKVNVDGDWLAVDATWNDSVPANEFLLITDGEFTGYATRTEDDYWIVDSAIDDYATP